MPETRDAESSPFRSVWARLRRNRAALAGLGILAVLILGCVGASLFSPYEYNDMFADRRLASPEWQTEGDRAPHILGTDLHGRDLFTRLLHGGRISLLVGLAAALGAVGIGTVVGLAAGFRGGWVDATLMRLTDTVFAFPSLLLALAVQAMLETQSVWVVAAVLGSVGWPSVARVVRAQVLVVRELDYVRAAETIGATRRRTAFVHILPNVASPILVLGTLSVGGNILAEAGLSFLGLGTQEPLPSWGKMLADGMRYGDYPWLSAAPGCAIVVTVLAVNLLGDGLRDALDPRVKTR